MQKNLDEYKEVQRLRESWNNAISRWNQIFIPLTLGIVTLLLTQFPKTDKEELGQPYLIIGGLLLGFFLLWWRIACHSIDKQIINFYPRYLELEKLLRFHLQTSYYFNNLSKKAKNKLAEILKEKISSKDFKKMNYRRFKDLTNDPQKFLLIVWDELKRKSVGWRGNFTLDLFAFGLIFGYIIFYVGYCLKWWNNLI